MTDRITILTQYFYPETAATAQLLADLAVALSKRGFKVDALTAQPTYHERLRLPRKEMFEGVSIVRCHSFRFGRHHVLGRLLAGVSFAVVIWGWLLFSRNRSPVLVVTTPPYLGWGCWLAQILRRRKYVLLIHDVYPEIAVRLGFLKPNGLIAWIWRALNRWTYRRASAVITLGECVKSVIEEQAQKKLPSIEVIHNWVDEQAIRPLPKKDNWFAQQNNLIDATVALYSGNLGRFHNLESFIKAADQLRNVPDIRFLFVGDGAKKAPILKMAESMNLSNVQFLPHQAARDLPYSLSSGDIGLVSLVRGTEDFSVPSKVYGYLAAGLPLLAVVCAGSDVARIIERYHCGIRVDQGDVDGIRRALITCHEDPRLLQEMKMNARRCSEKIFGKEQAMERYATVLRSAFFFSKGNISHQED